MHKSGNPTDHGDQRSGKPRTAPANERPGPILRRHYFDDDWELLELRETQPAPNKVRHRPIVPMLEFLEEQNSKKILSALEL